MDRDTRAVEADIVRLRSAWTDAIRERDEATLDRLMADEFVFIDARWRWGKERFIANVHRWGLVGMTFDDVLVRDYGLVAAMHARVALHACLDARDRRGGQGTRSSLHDGTQPGPPGHRE